MSKISDRFSSNRLHKMARLLVEMREGGAGHNGI
jgi:hypothetical protein